MCWRQRRISFPNPMSRLGAWGSAARSTTSPRGAIGALRSLRTMKILVPLCGAQPGGGGAGG